MKLALNLSLLIFALFTFSENSFALTDYAIKMICKKEKRKSTCRKNLVEKRTKLQKGYQIKIPVIPYQGN